MVPKNPLRICLIFFFYFYALTMNAEIGAGKPPKNDQNIGTVLFERTDCAKHCWTSEEFTILNSRRMFQDILPKVKVINSQNDEYIALLMDYFHICLECVRKLSIGKSKHLMLKALADTMGGYLHVYILPLTRHSYYAGNIKYRNAKRLFELFDELKNFLRTNGVGWLKPIVDTRRVKTPPIVVTPPQNSLSCEGLITYPASIAPGPTVDMDAVNFARKKKRHARRHRMARNPGAGSHGPVAVPLPFLDDEYTPNSIALPFKTENLQSLYCEKSAFILVKYYVASVKCIVSRSSSKFELLKFNQDMFEWLQISVYPHLDDEKWYPAFGGVLRVISSLRDTGLGEGAGRPMMLRPKEPTKPPEDEGVPPLYNGKILGDEDGNGNGNGVTFGTTELIVIALSGALVVWLLVGLILVCYRFLTRNSDECQPCESPSNTPVAVLYENTDYCVPECPVKSKKKNVGNKVKNWWKSRFGPCDGGCEYNEDEERCLAAISYSSKDTIDVGNGSSKSFNKKRGYNNSYKSPSHSATPRGGTSARAPALSSGCKVYTSSRPFTDRFRSSERSYSVLLCSESIGGMSKSGYTSDSTSNSEPVRTPKSR